MSQVKIVTDSTADLPRELIVKYNITVVPLMVIFNNNEIFRDGVDIDNEEFYRRTRWNERNIPVHLSRHRQSFWIYIGSCPHQAAASYPYIFPQR
ncbi:MAG: DegV family protein [Candidatus Syntrophopropionicum ammoniitolerans]